MSRSEVSASRTPSSSTARRHREAGVRARHAARLMAAARPATPARSQSPSRACCAVPGSTCRPARRSRSVRRSLAPASTDRDTTFWAGRATLVRRPEDHDLYDRAFAVFWEHARADDLAALEEEPLEITLAIDTRRGRRRAIAARIGRGVGRPDDRTALQHDRGAASQGLRRLLTTTSWSRRNS